jgi:oligopeptide/dipeptide ABC transporter ATP-binding protein
MTESLLRVENLQTYLPLNNGTVKAVDGVNFELSRGSILGIVGESGSGKSMTGLSILRLLPSRKWKMGGKIFFNGEDLLQKSEREMPLYRGRKISMIFQNALTALDPFYRVGDQLTEVIRIHQKLNKREAKIKAIEALDLVGIKDPDKRFLSYPHELSGGQRQRVVIAGALACNPDLLIADEPTTALDATVQLQIIDLLLKINRELGTSILMITHDFGVVSRMCHKVAVMYAGRIVEYGDVKTILTNPKHPYTSGLIQSVPRVHANHKPEPGDYVGTRERKREKLFQIHGSAPNLLNLPSGCAFAPRCHETNDQCADMIPNKTSFHDGHWVCCHQRTKTKEVGKYVQV